jgi:hypothetical protein
MEARTVAGWAGVKIVSLAALLAVLFACDCAEAAAVHQCSADAVAQAKKLLVFYLHLDDGTNTRQWSVDDNVRNIGKVSAIRGRQRYDVFEVFGNVYKGRYRMRLIYALVGGECILMGEEILEDAIL